MRTPADFRALLRRFVLPIVALLLGTSAGFARADAVFVCTNANANTFSSCAWPAQWTLKAPAAVTDADKLLSCPRGRAGPQNVAACTGVRWTTRPKIADTGLVGICTNVAAGGNVQNCNISSGGGEGFQTKETVFATPVVLPTVTLSANPTTVASGGTTTLTWTSSNVAGCTASGAWSGSKALSGSQVSAPLTATSAFTLSCATVAGGAVAATVSVAVNAPPPAPAPAPTLSFGVSPTSITSGSSATLSWTAANATSCTASGAWSGAKAVTGSQSTGTLSASQTYSLSCSGPGGSVSRSASVTVTAPPPAPTLSFGVSPTSITSGSTATLSWTAANATSCTASGAWSGTKALSGSQSTGVLTASQTYGLSCTGAGGSVNRSASVTVTAAPPPPPPPPPSNWTVFVCTNGAAASFGSCAWPAQWSLKAPAAVTATDRILHCPNGSVGGTDVSACANAQWTVLGAVPSAGLVGVCTGTAPGSDPQACNISIGGGEGWQAKATVFGGGTGDPGGPTTPPGTLSFQRSVIDTAAPGSPWMKNIADLNGDGLPDLIVSGSLGPVVWYQAPAWTKRTISASADSESGSATADIDGDGDIDVVVGKTWYENLGGGLAWTARPLPAGSAGTHDIVIADVNGDGRPDIAMRGETASIVTVYLQVSKTAWTVFNVDPGIGLNGLDVADLNADGFADIVVGGVWMENPRSAVATTAWTRRSFTSGWDPYASVKVIDLDRDGRPDIVLGVSENVGKLSWFKAPVDPRTGPWAESIVATGLDHVHGVSVVDVDRNGTLDIVASEYAGAGRLIVYQGNGAGTFTGVELGRDSLHNLRAADIDADGDIDFFGAYAWGSTVVMYRNTAVLANRVLVYSRTLGYRHASIPDGIAAIRSLGAANNFSVDATEDPAQFTPANLARYKALVFLNPSGDILDATQRAAFQSYIRNGGGWVGVHNPNALTLDGWAWYTGLVGARYATEIVSQPTRLQIVDATHASTAGLPNPWTLTVESYNWDVNPKTRGVKVLINLDESSVSGGTMGADHPFSWYHAYDGGRAWYTVGGADSANYLDTNFLRHLLGGIRYAGAF